MKFYFSEKVAPYEKFQYYNPKIKQIEQERNYAQNKTKKVSFFVIVFSFVRSSSVIHILVDRLVRIKLLCKK